MSTCAVAGTATASIAEADVVTSSKILTLTLTGDTWIEAAGETTYFGYQAQDAPYWDAGVNGFAIWNGNATFTCPGSGTQNVVEISSYLRLDSASGNVRLAIYSSDGATKIAEGTAEVAVTGSGSWQGHIGAANITPNPATLTGGTTYKIVVTYDSDTIGLLFDSAGSANDFVYKNPGGDYTAGFPASLPASANFGAVSVLIRAGVTP